MKKNQLRGWNKVFSFTFLQSIKNKSFKITTILVSIMLVIIFALANILPALIKDNDETKENNIENVYILNTAKNYIDNSISNILENKYKNIKVCYEEKSTPKDILKNSDKEKSICIQISEEKNKITLDGYALTEFLGSKDEIDSFIQEFSVIFKNYKFSSLGLNNEVVNKLTASVNTEIIAIGDKDLSIGETIFNMLAPMIIYLIMYFMIITYGQNIAKVVIQEKSSKLSQLLLTSIKPDALISGKVLAVSSSAVMQFFLWIISGTVGFFIGDTVAKSINKEYTNYVLKIVDIIAKNTPKGTFLISTFIIALIVFVFGFLFYCALSGLVAANIQNPEDLSSKMGQFMIPAVFSFLAVYFLPMAFEGVNLTKYFIYFPFTGAFSIPANLIIGKITLLESIIPFLIMLVTTCIMIVFTGKIYKKKIF